MKSFSRIAMVGCFLAICLAAYAGAKSGFGVSSFQDQEIMEEIEKECPNQYRMRDGECIRKSFRSLYFISRTGGSYGSGK